ncbi:TPA: carboxypeptidase-like regulatory domain-containing protein [Stenotrophomonas maltophilia]
MILTAVWGIFTPARAANALATDYTGFVQVDGKPAAGVPVALRHPSTGRILVRYTNAQGHYRFNNVGPDGVYSVEALGQVHQRRAFQGTTFRHDFKGGNCSGDSGATLSEPGWRPPAKGASFFTSYAPYMRTKQSSTAKKAASGRLSTECYL